MSARHCRPHRARLGPRVALAMVVVIPTAVIAMWSQPVTAASWSPVYNVDFPDPSISLFDGTYYAYSTQSGFANVPAATSTDGVNWTPVGGLIFPTLPVWAEFGFTWAPTVERNVSGQYVMFYTARDIASGLQCIGRAVSLSPTGPFVDSDLGPVICQTNVGGSIDPDIFTDSNGNSYLTWKSDGNSNSVVAGLWSQPLDSSFDLVGTPSLLLINGGQAWQGSIVEGPAMDEIDGTYYLFYSGNDFNSASYAIGYTTCSGPLGPCANTTFNPVLNTSEGMAGPGGETFFTGPEGQSLMGFAAWPGAVGYQNGGHRALYVAQLGVSGGVPYFDPYNQALPDAGYWQVGSDGGVFTFGAAGYHGSTGNIRLNKPIVGMSPTPDGGGYWLVASDGGIFAFGDAGYYGSTGNIRLNKPIVGMTPTPDGKGYWLVASDGGIFAFGDAQYQGSTGATHLNKPIVGMAVDAGTGGYWLVASDGGIFAFHAPYLGSTGAVALVKPIVSMAAMPDGGGYWLAASDGGVFNFGNAPFEGSAAGRSSSPVTSITTDQDGGGYWLSNEAGDIYTFGDAPAFGFAAANHPAASIVAMGADK
jgi:glycosyl hydrolase family 43